MTTVFKINKICDKILCDKNIRIVAISYRENFFFKSQPGIKIYQTKQEIEKSLANATLRWVSRRSLLSIGKPIYAMAKYEKVKRITIPFGRYGIILCTVNKDSDADLIATQMIKILKTYKE